MKPKKRKPGSGRPPAAKEDLMYSGLATPEKKKYHREFMQRTRSSTDVSQESTNPTLLTPPTDPLLLTPLEGSAETSRGKGRPPVGDKAMTPSTR